MTDNMRYSTASDQHIQVPIWSRHHCQHHEQQHGVSSSQHCRGQLVKFLLSAIVAMVISSVLVGIIALLAIFVSKNSSNTSTSFNHPSDKSLCNPHPISLSIPLPELCRITLSNDHTINSTSYTTSYCPNCLCKNSNEEENQRHCCTAIKTTNISFSCPNYLRGERVTIPNVPTECGCVPCEDIHVVFMLKIVEENQEPIIIANVSVDQLESYQSDELGYAGFSVPATQAKIRLKVTAIGFATFESDYFVLPGQTNTHTITLTPLMIRTLFPPQAPFLLSLSTFMLHLLPTQFDFEMLTSAEIENLVDDLRIKTSKSFLFFPFDSFPPNQFITFLSNPKDRNPVNLKVSFTTAYNDNLSYRTPLYAISSGQLDIRDENGDPFIFPTSNDPRNNFGLLTLVSSDLQPSYRQLNLFAYNEKSEHFDFLSKESLTLHSKDDSILILFTFNSISPPLNYLIAYEEPSTCFIPVKSHDTNGFLQTDQDRESTMVRATTRIWYSEADIMVSVTHGHIDGCVLVPCKGEVVMELLGASSEGERRGEVRIDNIERELSREKERIVFRNRDKCEAVGFASSDGSSSLSSSAQVDIMPDYCISPQRTLQHPVMSTTDLYCSVRVAVSLSQHTHAIIVATTSNMDIQTEEINNESEGEVSEVDADYSASGISGSGSGDGVHESCVHHRCFTFACDLEVTLTANAKSADAQNDPLPPDNQSVFYPTNNNNGGVYFRDVSLYQANLVGGNSGEENGACVPYSAPPLADILGSNSRMNYLENLALTDLWTFTYRASGGVEGVSMSAVAEVAHEKCSQSEKTGIQFQC